MAPIDSVKESEALDANAEEQKAKSATGPAVSTIRARGAVETGAMRYVWAISLVLAVLALAVVYGLVRG
jgi:hypothetical protein